MKRSSRDKSCNSVFYRRRCWIPARRDLKEQTPGVPIEPSIEQRHRMTGLLASLSVLLCWSATSAAWAEAWQQDFEQAWRQAQRSKRPLLVHFYADWCGPCQQMDRSVLNAPEVLRSLNNGFVAVKVNVDQRRDLAQRFSVHSVPTDMCILPDGRIASRSTGFQGKQAYLAQLARVLSRHQQSQRVHAVAETSPDKSSPPHEVVSTDANSARSQSAWPTSRNQGHQAAELAGLSSQRPSTAFVGLEGYSPVTLKKYKKWVKGDPAFAAQYQGVTFYMANAEELAEFDRAPDLYVPRLLGCDPVILYLTDRAVPGSIKYGAFFDGQLYLFVSEKTRQLFKENPLRYVQVRNVLSPDELIWLSRR